MIYEEDIARQKLSLVVDNSERRQLPYPAPWYARWSYLAGLIAGVAFIYVVGWPILCIVLGLE